MNIKAFERKDGTKTLDWYIKVPLPHLPCVLPETPCTALPEKPIYGSVIVGMWIQV